MKTRSRFSFSFLVLSAVLALAATARAQTVFWRNLSAIPSPTLSLGGDATGSVTFLAGSGATLNLTLANTAVAAGTYQSVTVDAKGRVTAGTNPTTLAGFGVTNGAALDTLGAAGTTGSGAVVRATTPTFVTPILGTATATNLTTSGVGNQIVLSARATGGNTTLFTDADVFNIWQTTTKFSVGMTTGNVVAGGTGTFGGGGTFAGTLTSNPASGTSGLVMQVAGTRQSQLVFSSPSTYLDGPNGGSVVIRINPDSPTTAATFSTTGLNIPATTPSTLYTNGAITSAGGVGIAGNINSNGTIAAPEFKIGSTTTGASITSALNSRDVRGGLAFDKTAAAQVRALLSSAAKPGTDPFSIVIVTTLSATPASDCLAAITSTGYGAQTPGFLVCQASAVEIDIISWSAGGYYITPFSIPSATGKVVTLVAVRNGATASLYMNGIALTPSASFGGGSSPPVDHSQSQTGDYLASGASDVLTTRSGVLYGLSLYNLALSQADITEIVESGGAVPERFKFGSQVNVYASDFSAGPDGWGEYAGNQTIATGNIDGIAGVDDTLRISKNTTGLIQYSIPPFSATLGKAYEMVFDYYLDAGTNITGIQVYGGTTITTVPTVASSWQTGKVVRWTMGTVGVHYFGASSGVLATGANLYIKNARTKRIGAVVHYDADLDGIGYQLHDQSTNKLDAVLTTTGVTWTKPAKSGYLRGTLTWAGTHETKSVLGGQRELPNEAVIERFSLKPTAANTGSGMTIGATGDATRYTGGSYVTYTTAKKIVHASALAGAVTPSGTTDNNCVIGIDPDTSNYTGSIAFEAQYVVTEGTP